MKTLLVNGCSWTYGGGLDTPDTVDHINKLHNEIVWSAHLKSKLQYDNLVNLAVGCGSNQRICRTTFEWVMKQTAETLQNTTVVIQWSLNDRYEYYVPTSNNDPFNEAPARLEDLHPKVKITKAMIGEKYALQPNNLTRWAKVSPSSFVSPFEDHHEDDVRNVAFNRYKTYTEIEGVYTWLTQLGFLHDLFTRHNIEYYYWFFCNEVFAYPDHIQNYMYENFNFLEPERKHKWTYERIDDIEHNKDPHPSIRGHAQLGNHIYTAIAKTKNKLRSP